MPAEPPAVAPAVMPASDAERERFLLEARVVRVKGAPGGITGSYRATLRLGEVEHDAHIQPHEEYKTQLVVGVTTELDFRDSWRNNVAAYRLDRLLGLGMVPVTVVRRDTGSNKLASFTWWVDDVLMVERERHAKKLQAPDVRAWNEQMYVVRAFDQLIYNFDRNLGNLVIDEDWRIWMIDHTRAFKVFGELRSEKNLAERCDFDLLRGLRALDKPALRAAMKDLLSEGQIDGLLARRDLIVARYEQSIAASGEDRVLYRRPQRTGVAAAAPAH
jgi:hypothetical protein